MSTEETPARMNAATLARYQHDERMASAQRQSTPEPKIELDYKKVAGADPLTTWHLELVPGFDDDEVNRMYRKVCELHEALLGKFSANGVPI
jgi:hypothetical protein